VVGILMYADHVDLEADAIVKVPERLALCIVRNGDFEDVVVPAFAGRMEKMLSPERG
jgi:hypothetical protein